MLSISSPIYSVNLSILHYNMYMYMYIQYLVSSDVKDEGRVLIGDTVVGVTERAWPFAEA